MPEQQVKMSEERLKEIALSGIRREIRCMETCPEEDEVKSGAEDMARQLNITEDEAIQFIQTLISEEFGEIL